MAHEQSDRNSSASLNETVEVKKSSSSSPVLSYITSGRMTAAEAIVLMAALKKAAFRPSVRPANGAAADQISDGSSEGTCRSKEDDAKIQPYPQ